MEHTQMEHTTVVQATLIDGKSEGNDVLEAVQITPVMDTLEENRKMLLAREAKKKAIEEKTLAKKKAANKSDEAAKKKATIAKETAKANAEKRRIEKLKQTSIILAAQYYSIILDDIMVKINDAYTNKEKKTTVDFNHIYFGSFKKILDMLNRQTPWTPKVPSSTYRRYNVFSALASTPYNKAKASRFLKMYKFDYEIFEKEIITKCVNSLRKKAFMIAEKEITTKHTTQCNNSGVLLLDHPTTVLTIYWDEQLYKEESEKN